MGRTIHEFTQKFSSHRLDECLDGTDPVNQIKLLSQKKFEIEAELRLQFNVLKDNNVDLDSSLVDPSGFPRSDIPDLASVRVARVKILELKNDLRQVVAQLAQTLPLVMPPSQATGLSSQSSSITPALSRPSASAVTPFAKVDMVSAGSPAELAGLEVNDQIIRFGHVNASNHDGLKALGTLVGESEGKELNIAWFRSDSAGKRQMFSKVLTPRADWGGRGLLGCHVIPL